MTTAQLARDVLDLLDLQRRYFRAGGPAKSSLLAECIRLEEAMRKKCNAVLHPEQVQPQLFETEPPGGPPH